MNAFSTKCICIDNGSSQSEDERDAMPSPVCSALLSGRFKRSILGNIRSSAIALYFVINH